MTNVEKKVSDLTPEELKSYKQQVYSRSVEYLIEYGGPDYILNNCFNLLYELYARQDENECGAPATDEAYTLKLLYETALEAKIKMEPDFEVSKINQYCKI